MRVSAAALAVAAAAAAAASACHVLGPFTAIFAAGCAFTAALAAALILLHGRIRRPVHRRSPQPLRVHSIRPLNDTRVPGHVITSTAKEIQP